jgi:drug/metabolite transporter (DMT)-like permease
MLRRIFTNPHSNWWTWALGAALGLGGFLLVLDGMGRDEPSFAQAGLGAALMFAAILLRAWGAGVRPPRHGRKPPAGPPSAG